MTNGIGNANPSEQLFAGSGATVTEGAAESFTRFLEDEAEATNPRPPKAPKPAKAPEPKGGAEENGFGQDPDARQPDAERDEGPDDDDEADDPLRDPILDDHDDEPEPKKGKEDGDADDDTDADDEGTDTEDDTDEDEGDDPEFDVTVNGEVQKVKQSELIAGYSREADYRQKTQALSAEREEIDTYATQVVETQKRYEAGIEMYGDLIKAVMPTEAEWEALKKANPEAYITAQEQWGKFIGAMETSKAERDKLAADKAEENTRAHNAYIKAENKKLLEVLPQLGNPKVAKQFSAKIFAYGKRMGYAPEEMTAGLINHRDVQTAYYAARYLEIQDSRKANQGKGNSKPKPRTAEVNSSPRPIASPKARRQARNSQEQRRADARLERSGSMQDAAGAFSAMFRE